MSVIAFLTTSIGKILDPLGLSTQPQGKPRPAREIRRASSEAERSTWKLVRFGVRTTVPLSWRMVLPEDLRGQVRTIAARFAEALGL